MRIITGSAKGRKIKAPKDSKVIRPALAQVREAIFSSLGDISDKVVMDIFAGTGSLGLEALSRGCEKVYFVDGDATAVRLILENLEHLGFLKNAHVFKRNMPRGLESIKLDQKPNVIFVDPPYDKGLIDKTLVVLAKQNYVDPETLIIIEHTKREVPANPGFEVVKQKNFGQTFLTYLKIK